ncbi:hypothetical protein RND71_030329 [Anisodus tanguticus]|uniref:Uncharacterized protein n=1 Tax=Anisodus tanguticus TaxID=243964 RepID=A0AAE1RFV2_9SOLA|nr:hypothetical protein RND71_030329 [Anisodus tanguticus]
MRKSPFSVANGSETSFASFPLTSASSIFTSPANFPSDFNSTFPLTDLSSNSTFRFPSAPIADGTFDFVTICFISGLILLSLLSFIFTFHLRLRSRQYPHLQNFNSLWTVRLLLVLFAFLWAFNEVFRLHLIPRKYNFPFLPTLTLNQQSNLCKVHVVLSLGLFEPGFLITLLFLVNVSIKTQSPSGIWAAIVVWPICLPLLVLQILCVFFSPLQEHIPKYMHSSSFLSIDLSGNKTVLCTYPLYSGILFGGFTVAYLLAFLFSCWRVISFVINRKIQVRLNLLATSFMIALPVQIVCLVLLPIWPAEDPIHGVAVLVMFLAVAWCVAVGEVTLVIKPIADAFVAGRACSCHWNPGAMLRRTDVGGGRVEERS